MSTIQAESRRLSTNSLVYLLPSVLVRGASFLLTPLYAWTMRPADFAIIGVASTIAGLLGTALGFALHGSVTRMHFECPDEPARKRYYGTIVVFLLTVPVALTAILEGLGRAGFLEIFQTVSFRPHLELVIWTALLNVYASLPTALFMAREEPTKAAALNILMAAAQIGLSLFFVLGLGQGAIGLLRGGLAAAAWTAAISLWTMRKHVTVAVDFLLLRHSLAFSLPLVPHLLGNWALSVSDRLILDYCHVSAATIGIYSLAYYFSFAVSMFAGAVTSALSPMATRLLKSDPRNPELPVLGNQAILAIVVVALACVLFAPEALRVLTPKAYHSAAALVPWVVVGAVFQGMYLINSIGTWFSMRTLAVPLITGSTVVINVGINLTFVPRYGAMAAAVSTALSYAIAAALHGWLAGNLHPIDWDYWRWLRMVGCGAFCATIGHSIPSESMWLAVPLKLALLGGLFPASLVGTRVLTGAQLIGLVSAARRLVVNRALGRVASQEGGGGEQQ